MSAKRRRDRRTSAVAALVAGLALVVGVGGTIALLVSPDESPKEPGTDRPSAGTGPRSPEAPAPGGAQPPPPAASPDRLAGPVVDPESRGGRCDDRRSARAASRPATPWCRLPERSQRLRGSEVVLRAGSHGSVSLDAGRDGRGIALRAFPGETGEAAVDSLRIAGEGPVRVSGLKLGSVELDPGTRRVTLDGNRVAGGIAIEDGAAQVRIERNEISAPAGDGVIFATGDGEAPVAEVSIEGNRFTGIGRVAINARNFRDVTIAGNSFAAVASHDGEVHPDVIRTFAGGRGLTIRDNTISDARAQGIFVKDGAVTDLVIEGNVITGIGGGFWAVNLYEVRSARIVGNTVWGNDQGVVVQGPASEVTLEANVLQSLRTPGEVSWERRRCNLVGAQAKAAVAQTSDGPKVDRGAMRRLRACAASAA